MVFSVQTLELRPKAHHFDLLLFENMRISWGLRFIFQENPLGIGLTPQIASYVSFVFLNMIFTRINHRYHSLNSRVHVNVGRSRWLTAKIGMLSVVMFAILLQIESDMGTALTGRWKAGGRHYDWSNPTNQRHQNPSQKNTCDTLSKGGPRWEGQILRQLFDKF